MNERLRPTSKPRAAYPEPTTPAPSYDEIAVWLGGVQALATDGCAVEVDGECEHGYPSWAIYLGYI